MEQNGAPLQPKDNNNWFYRHKIIICFSLISLFLLSIGLFPHTHSQPAVQGVSTSIQTATPTTLPSDTPTLTLAPSPTLTLTPTPTTYIAPTKTTIQSTQPTAAQDQGLSNNNYYLNSSGNEVHSPAYSNNGSVPAGASAKCGDGTYSFSQSRRGTCSHHGGVAQWY